MQRMIGGCSTRTSNELRPSEFVYCPHRKPKKTIPQPKVHLHEHERTSCLRSEARRRRRPAAERRTMPRGDTPASGCSPVCFVRACLANQCEVSCRRGERRRRTAMRERVTKFRIYLKTTRQIVDGRTTDGNRTDFHAYGTHNPLYRGSMCVHQSASVHAPFVSPEPNTVTHRY